LEIDREFIDDARCDPSPNARLNHQLGEPLGVTPLDVPIGERVESSVVTTDQEVCPGGGFGFGVNSEVTVTNLSPSSWQNLFFVANFNVDMANTDGTVTNEFGFTRNAFRIDSSGVNANLISESFAPPNEIFEPGETWVFLVTDYADIFGPLPLVPFSSIPFGFDIAGPGPFIGLTGAFLLAEEVDSITVGGEYLTLDITALLLAGTQSFSWMIPVVLSVLGIGLFVFRRSENS